MVLNSVKRSLARTLERSWEEAAVSELPNSTSPPRVEPWSFPISFTASEK